MTTRWLYTKPAFVGDKLIEAGMVVEDCPPEHEGSPWSFWVCNVADKVAGPLASSLEKLWQITTPNWQPEGAQALD